MYAVRLPCEPVAHAVMNAAQVFPDFLVLNFGLDREHVSNDGLLDQRVAYAFALLRPVRV